MKKVFIWFLTAQKFLFGFTVIFGAIPVTYAVSDMIFDNSFFIFLFGIIIYVLCVIPLAYALGVGYDRLNERVAGKIEETQVDRHPIAEKESDFSFNIHEDDEELTIVEKERHS